ncbi:nuclear transport factor 2 family protein [Glaciimonas immobilis]|nr:nuclear transport factor 2 family protein [Glaciimonas immobilis]
MINDQSKDVLRIVAFFETLTLDDLVLIPLIYAQDAWFKDPFNEVTGINAIKQVYAHMFVQVDTPRFIVTHHMLQADVAFLTWEFRFKMKRFSRAEQCIKGASHLRLNKHGYIVYHRDYWDAAEELYEKLPVVGSLMRLLKRGAKARDLSEPHDATGR